METKRYIEQEENRVFLIKEETRQEDGREITKTLKEEINMDSINQYLEDDKVQAVKFDEQEVQTINKIKILKKDISKHIGERGYNSYKKNFAKYELFEKILELKFSFELFNDEVKKDLTKYSKKRNQYKHFYTTITLEKQLEELQHNLKVFDEIRAERREFLDIIEEVKKVL